MIFKDVDESHWAYEAIKELSDARYLRVDGILVGYEDGTFKPDEPVTRAEMCEIIKRLGW